jgi:hypothetical protein
LHGRRSLALVGEPAVQHAGPDAEPDCGGGGRDRRVGEHALDPAPAERDDDAALLPRALEQPLAQPRRRLHSRRRIRERGRGLLQLGHFRAALLARGEVLLERAPLVGIERVECVRSR